MLILIYAYIRHKTTLLNILQFVIVQIVLLHSSPPYKKSLGNKLLKAQYVLGRMSQELKSATLIWSDTLFGTEFLQVLSGVRCASSRTHRRQDVFTTPACTSRVAITWQDSVLLSVLRPPCELVWPVATHPQLPQSFKSHNEEHR